jgi:hypothetical protein
MPGSGAKVLTCCFPTVHSVHSVVCAKASARRGFCPMFPFTVWEGWSMHVIPSHTTSSLRFYANPLKLGLYLAGAVGFVIVGYLLLQDPKIHADMRKTLGTYAAVGFFGLCAVVFLFMILMTLGNIMLRRPVLEVDAQGWHYMPRTYFGAIQVVDWQDIAAIGAYRQRGARGTSMYYLIVSAREPEKLPRQRLKSLVGRAYPAIREMAILVPLNVLFLRVTPRKCESLLARIRMQFAHELQFYGIRVDDEVRPM